MVILEKISPDTIVFLQTHKRIWPASQRDALFWSHMRKVLDKQDKLANDEWIVCNHSIELDAYPSNTGKCVRIFLTVILYCQTYIDPAVIAKGQKPTRDDITCKITYCSEGESEIMQSKQKQIIIELKYFSESGRLGSSISTSSCI